MDRNNCAEPNFKCLYLFENQDYYIVEYKRLNLPADADLADKYKWIKVPKDLTGFSDFHFRSMDSSLQVEERFFDEGYLKFTPEEATFIEKFNSSQIQLKRLSTEAIPSDLQTFIAKLCA